MTYVEKRKVLISGVVVMQLICVFVFLHMQKANKKNVLMTRLKCTSKNSFLMT